MYFLLLIQDNLLSLELQKEAVKESLKILGHLLLEFYVPASFYHLQARALKQADSVSFGGCAWVGVAYPQT